MQDRVGNLQNSQKRGAIEPLKSNKPIDQEFTMKAEVQKAQQSRMQLELLKVFEIIAKSKEQAQLRNLEEEEKDEPQMLIAPDEKASKLNIGP